MATQTPDQQSDHESRLRRGSRRWNPTPRSRDAADGHKNSENETSHYQRPRPERLSSGYDDKLSQPSIADQENAADQGPGGSPFRQAGRALRDEIGETMGSKGGKSLFRGAEKALPLPPAAKTAAKVANWFFGNKKKKAGSGIGVLIVGILIFMGTFVKTFELAHVSQLLQKLGFSQNEDFSDGRSARQIMYKIGGETERSRLGLILNPFADAWEEKLIEDIGARPLYNAQGTRQTGYEILDKDKFEEALKNTPKLRSLYDKALDNGARLRSGQVVIDEGSSRPTSRGNNTPRISENHLVFDTQEMRGTFGLDLAKSFNRAISQAVVGPRIISAPGARLQNKRAGFLTKGWRLFRGVEQKRDARALAKVQKKQQEDFDKKVNEDFANDVQKGVQKGTIKSKDAQELNDEVEKAEEQARAEGKSEPEVKVARTAALRSALTKASGPYAALGVACAVHDLGTDAAEAQYLNLMLPMMRAGATYGVAGGDQERAGSGDGSKLKMDEVRAMTEKLHGDDGTSWNQNTDFRLSEGKQPLGDAKFDTDPAAQLGNAGKKKPFFALYDQALNVAIPGSTETNAVLKLAGIDLGRLGSTCGQLDFIAGLPIAKQIGELMQGALNAGLSFVGAPTTDEAYDSAIKFVNGKGLDFENLSGAPFFGVIVRGVKLLANDRAQTMGGEALDTTEAAAQDKAMLASWRQEEADKPLLARVFDPTDYMSLTSQVAYSMPSSSSQVASLINPLHSFGSIFSTFTPKASAAEIPDFGVKTYGYSQRDQEDDRYENPFENARIVEDEANGGKLLNDMNEKYGKCFGMEVTYDDAGVHLKNGETVNVFKLEDENNKDFKDCRDVRKLGDNDPERINYTRYRFYLADAQIALSLACYEGKSDDATTAAACLELGIDTANEDGGATAGTGTVTEGSAQELAQKLLGHRAQGRYKCDNAGDCHDLQQVAEGKPIGGQCGVDSLDPKVLQILLYLIDSGYKIGTYALCGDHSPTDGLNGHHGGKAVDISSINGSAVNQASAKSITLELDKFVFGLKNELAPRQIITGGVGATRTVDPDFVQYNRVMKGNEGASAVAAFGSETMAGHTDHVHVGY